MPPITNHAVLCKRKDNSHNTLGFQTQATKISLHQACTQSSQREISFNVPYICMAKQSRNHYEDQVAWLRKVQSQEISRRSLITLRHEDFPIVSILPCGNVG